MRHSLDLALLTNQNGQYFYETHLKTLPAYNANTPPHPGMKLWSTNNVLKSWDMSVRKGVQGGLAPQEFDISL